MTRKRNRRTIVDAIEERYSDMDELNFSNDSFFIKFYMPKDAPKRGESGRIIASSSMSLDHQRISELGCKEYLNEACQNAKLVDLSNNEFESWEQIIEILDTLKNVYLLNMSHNNIFQVPKEWPDTQWANLQTLSLNGLCLTSFDVVSSLLIRLPALRSLNLAVNRLYSSDFPNDFTHETLDSLDITKNQFCSWKQVSLVANKFPKLKTLMLCNNPITHIDPQWNWSPVEDFPSLENLYLTRCYLDTWRAIECLKDFPSLKSVHLNYTPFTHFLPSDLRREIVTTFLNKRMLLNGSEITADEFEDSVFSFLSYYKNIEPKPDRYHVLSAERNCEVDANITCQQFILVNVRLRGGRFTIRIDEDTLAHTFIDTMAEIMEEPQSNLQLFILRRKLSGKKLKKNDLNVSLNSLGITSGDTIIITTLRRL